MLANVITFLSTLISHIMNLPSELVKESSDSKGKLLLIRIATPALTLLQQLKRAL